MHLQNIASLLEDHRTKTSMPNIAVQQEDDVVGEELLPVLSSITDIVLYFKFDYHINLVFIVSTNSKKTIKHVSTKNLIQFRRL
jgi:hypothetical protein